MKKSKSKITRFREFRTSSGKLILAGKDAKNNEQLIKQIKPNEHVFHTAKPGSPFVNIKSNKSDKERVTKKDIKEASTFCASKSQDWRDNKSDVEVHHFKGKDVYKRKGMKSGTFGVRNFKIIKVKKREIEKFIKK